MAPAADMPPRMEMIQSWHLTYQTTRNMVKLPDINLDSLYQLILEAIRQVRATIRKDRDIARTVYLEVEKTIGAEPITRILASRHERIMQGQLEADGLHTLFISEVEDLYYDLVMLAEDNEDEDAEIIVFAQATEKSEEITYEDPRTLLRDLIHA